MHHFEVSTSPDLPKGTDRGPSLPLGYIRPSGAAFSGGVSSPARSFGMDSFSLAFAGRIPDLRPSELPEFEAVPMHRLRDFKALYLHIPVRSFVARYRREGPHQAHMEYPLGPSIRLLRARACGYEETQGPSRWYPAPHHIPFFLTANIFAVRSAARSGPIAAKILAALRSSILERISTTTSSFSLESAEAAS